MMVSDRRARGVIGGARAHVAVRADAAVRADDQEVLVAELSVGVEDVAGVGIERGDPVEACCSSPTATATPRRSGPAPAPRSQRRRHGRRSSPSAAPCGRRWCGCSVRSRRVTVAVGRSWPARSASAPGRRRPGRHRRAGCRRWGRAAVADGACVIRAASGVAGYSAHGSMTRSARRRLTVASPGGRAASVRWTVPSPTLAIRSATVTPSVWLPVGRRERGGSRSLGASRRPESPRSHGAAPGDRPRRSGKPLMCRVPSGAVEPRWAWTAGSGVVAVTHVLPASDSHPRAQTSAHRRTQCFLVL